MQLSWYGAWPYKLLGQPWLGCRIRRETMQPGSQAARQPGGQAAKQPGGQAGRQPGGQAARRPGGQAATV
eukprot:15328205-Heterocapsa_arctica.AAC.1